MPLRVSESEYRKLAKQPKPVVAKQPEPVAERAQSAPELSARRPRQAVPVVRSSNQDDNFWLFTAGGVVILFLLYIVKKGELKQWAKILAYDPQAAQPEKIEDTGSGGVVGAGKDAQGNPTGVYLPPGKTTGEGTGVGQSVETMVPYLRQGGGEQDTGPFSFFTQPFAGFQRGGGIGGFIRGVLPRFLGGQ